MHQSHIFVSHHPTTPTTPPPHHPTLPTNCSQALAVAAGGPPGAIYEARDAGLTTRLTVDSFEETVQAEIDAGRTMFVRWIASEG